MFALSSPDAVRSLEIAFPEMSTWHQEASNHTDWKECLETSSSSLAQPDSEILVLCISPEDVE